MAAEMEACRIATGGANGVLRQDGRQMRINMTCGSSIILEGEQVTIKEETCSCCPCCDNGCECNQATQTFPISSIVETSQSWAFRDRELGMLWAPCNGKVVTLVVDDKESGKRLNIGIATTDPEAVMSLLAHAAGKRDGSEAGETPADFLAPATEAAPDSGVFPLAVGDSDTSGDPKASNTVVL